MRNVPAAAATIAAALLALCGSRAEGATGPSTVRITAVQLTSHVVARRGSVGELEVIRLRLFNPSVTSRSIGRGDLICTRLDSRSRSCSGVYSLPRGRLLVGGLVTTRLLYELGVTGGTGLYDNARGSVVITATSFTPRKEVLVFRLTG